jgi:excisionase family DNA binding protein
MNGVQESPVMTLAEAAELLRSPVYTVRDLIWSGQLAYQKVGRRFLVSRRELVELIESGWKREGAAMAGKSRGKPNNSL